VTTVLVVDDHPLFRDGLVALLATIPDIDVIAAVGSGAEAIDVAARRQPDVVLMDLNLPGVPGLEATRRIVAGGGDTAVLVLTMVDDDDSVLTALQVGARGYVLKGASQEEVLAAIRTVAAGGAVFGQRVAERVLRRRDPRTGLRLTEREATVLTLLSDGKSNVDIARELGITLKTVQNHVSHILTKMQVRDRTQAALRARGL
jgi:DNA-binding NarL/FixJ family response regulator